MSSFVRSRPGLPEALTLSNARSKISISNTCSSVLRWLEVCKAGQRPEAGVGLSQGGGGSRRGVGLKLPGDA